MFRVLLLAALLALSGRAADAGPLQDLHKICSAAGTNLADMTARLGADGYGPADDDAVRRLEHAAAVADVVASDRPYEEVKSNGRALFAERLTADASPLRARAAAPDALVLLSRPAGYAVALRLEHRPFTASRRFALYSCLIASGSDLAGDGEQLRLPSPPFTDQASFGALLFHREQEVATIIVSPHPVDGADPLPAGWPDLAMIAYIERTEIEAVSQSR